MNEGELVYTGPGELAALRTQNAELVAKYAELDRVSEAELAACEKERDALHEALLQVRAYAPLELQSRINAALRYAAPPASGEAAMSDGAIYAAKLRSLDPEAYDRLLDEIKAHDAPGINDDPMAAQRSEYLNPSPAAIRARKDKP